FDAVSGVEYRLDTNVYSSSAVTVPANFSNACVSNIPPICTIKKTFVKTYYLPPNLNGYVIAWQRCCRNAAIVNIEDPGNNGCTYYCVIPPITKATNNNS